MEGKITTKFLCDPCDLCGQIYFACGFAALEKREQIGTTPSFSP